MDLERLNKSQIVLLTLLVSFVTSIATGIVTVALMEQAPQAITQTVNRVVERTIEKVAPEQVAAAAALGLKNETVIIRESDLLATAIDTVAPSVVRLYMPGKDEAGQDVRLFVGHGIVVDSKGIIIADAGTPDGQITVVRSDGKEVPASILSRYEGANMVRLQTADGTEPLEWKPATISTKTYGLGKAVVAIGGLSSTRVAQGIITSSGTEGDTKGFVETDISADSFSAGSPLIDADGSVIAVATRESRAAAAGGFLASSRIVLQNNDTEGAKSAP